MDIHNQIFYTTLCSCILSLTGQLPVLFFYLVNSFWPLMINFVEDTLDFILHIFLTAIECLESSRPPSGQEAKKKKVKILGWCNPGVFTYLGIRMLYVDIIVLYVSWQLDLRVVARSSCAFVRLVKDCVALLMISVHKRGRGRKVQWLQWVFI